MKFEYLFKPGRLGTLELKNRIVMLPMGTLLAGEWGQVTEELIHWYARRAKGGAGLIIVEVCMAATAIDPLRLISRVLRADDDCYVPGLACLVDAVHENGAKIGICLNAGAGAQASGGPWIPGFGAVTRMQPVSPSGIPAYGVAEHGAVKQPRSLTIEEIEKCIDLCGESARRLKKAGFDLLEIHAPHGYLIAQFLSPYFNKRTDKYGGSLDNRCRFLFEIIAAIRRMVGYDFPLTVRYSIDEAIEGGRDVRESQQIAKKLEEMGIHGISCSVGVYGANIPNIPPYYFPRGSLAYLAEAIKEAVKIPVVAAGRLDDPELAEQILRDGKADFIGLGRGLIADPDWPQKAANGKVKEIRKCLACNDCRIAIHTPRPIRCAVNPVAGREVKYEVMRPAEMRKKVVIVGGGPAGMETARVAVLKGHKVILFEAKNELGGMLNLGSTPPHKEILKSITEYYARELDRLGVDVRMGKKATTDLIIREDPDCVIVATGGVALIPDIPGIDKAIVVTALDALSCAKRTGQEVIVAGGGAVGCEVANYLAQQKKKVTIVEMLDTVGLDMDSWIWKHLSAELEKRNVKIMTSMKIDEITDQGIIVIDRNCNKIFLKSDNVVLALGLRGSNDLSGKLEGKVKKVFTIGDAKLPRRIRESISEGYITAYNL
jgi:2,4-dienoyl-CoA reductase-like NADH-dependent reductase (Old Yellow Enzyme family)/thioredoxin reductase